jgi:hypothetical protein
MASTVLKGMKNKPGTNYAGRNTAGGDMMSQFLQFKKQIEASGKDPQAMLNELLASGKVPPAMLNKAKTLATVFANKFKSGR